ncbi:MAG: TonB-dependent receptor [Flavobacteriaceae bacterium]|nr:TonB-dependent receptor [Flavobacteriaceae bacterium]
MSKLITSIFLLVFAISFSQKDSIHILDEIVLKGSFSPSLHSGYIVESLSDSILKSNNQSLGNLLQNQLNLYFKQNGNGMVSSISLRGTNASQTGVYWNGIAINSSLNGQTDFNTLSASSFDEVEIRRGGASVLLGSGAIGGAINLSDQVLFKNIKEANLQLIIGSYQTYITQLQAVVSNNDFFAKVTLGGTKSENDYPYLDSDLKNENGQFKNYNINGVFGHQINKKNSLTYFTSFVKNDRNTSRTLTAFSNAKLENTNSRNLLDWKYLGNRFTSSLKLAYLTEKFTYFFDKEKSNYSTGKSNNFISKYDFTYFLNNNIFFNVGIEYKNERGEGSNIPKQDQNIFNNYILFHHQPIAKLNYNLSIRKGFSSVFEVPFIYAVDAKYDLSKSIAIKTAFSTNYRTPTFNDLYWDPGGNPDLKSEKSKSTEIGLSFNNQWFQFHATSYYIKSKDLIQWRPVSGTLWQPQNVQDVSNYGFEVSAAAEKKFNQHIVGLKIQYDYTKSEDEAIKKQLIYVPFHKANSILNYQFKKWDFVYNLQYTGKVYITTSNTQSIDAYLLSNIDIQRSFLKNKMQVAFKINNLFDKNYQSVAYRPMPSRNYTLQINFKI